MLRVPVFSYINSLHNQVLSLLRCVSLSLPPSPCVSRSLPLRLSLPPSLSHRLHIQGTQADDLMRDFINDIFLALEHRTYLADEVMVDFQVSANEV